MMLNNVTTTDPKISISRSKFPIRTEHKTTMISGRCYPTFCMEVVPGDTIKMKMSQVIRSLTPVVPTMDNSKISHYFFYCPYKFLYDDKLWQRVFGENTAGAWANNTNVLLPSIKDSFNLITSGTNFSSGVEPGDVFNRLGMPIGKLNNGTFKTVELGLNDAQLRMYWKCYQEYFRDQNTQAPDTYVQYLTKAFTDANLTVNNLIRDDFSTTVTEKGIYLSNRVHDLVGSLLPAPYKANGSVTIPIAGSNAIVKLDTVHLNTLPTPKMVYGTSGSVANGALSAVTGSTPYIASANTSTNKLAYDPNGTLYADLSNIATNVQDLVRAYNMYRIFARHGVSGTRYRELIRGEYGVTLHPLEENVPELLGGKNIPVQINQVLQTSSGTSTNPLGDTGAFSVTGDTGDYFTKSFDDFGMIMCITTIRTNESYTQGVTPLWTKRSCWDFYRPGLSFLGEVGFKNSLIYFDYNTPSNNDGNFGYAEYGFEYRDILNRVTGLLDPVAGDATLTPWTYAQKFSSLPVLNSGFMTFKSSNVDQTLVADAATTGYQYICDFFFEIEAVRPMPVHSELTFGSWY